MNRPNRAPHWLSRLALLLTLLITPWSAGAQAGSCSAVACVAAGPRLLSVDSQRSVILNGLFQGLLGGGSLTLSAADWNAIANADVNLGLFLDALTAEAGVGTTAEALNADVTLLQVLDVAAQAAQTSGNTAAVNALNLLRPALSAPNGTIRLGDLLKLEGSSAAFLTSQVNLLNLLTGSVQLFNYRNAVTTPTPVTLNALNVSLSGLGLGVNAVTPTVRVYLQVIEPPVYRCGPQGTQFNTAAIRAKLNVDLGGTQLNVLGLTDGKLTLTTLDLYLEVAKASGTIGTVDAISRALSLNAQPGLAQLGLGQISDSVFFNRSNANPFASLTPAIIGTVDLTVRVPVPLLPDLEVPIVLNVRARAFADGTYPLSTVTAAPPYPQTYTVGSSSAAVGTLVGTLLTSLGTPGNLTLELRDPAPLVPTALLTGTISAALSPVLSTLGLVLRPVLEAVLMATVDQVLRLLGIGIGEAVFTVGGVGNVCAVTGVVYHDRQPDGARDAENWDGPTTFVNAVTGGRVQASAQVPAGAGTFTLALGEGTYTLPVARTAAAISAGNPSGFVFVNPLNGTRTVTVTAASTSVPEQEFGLFQGDRLSGVVFRDDGRGAGGAAHDVTRQGDETPLNARTLTVSGTRTGAAVTRTAETAADGSYTLYVPGDWTGVTFRSGASATEVVTGVRLNGVAALTGDVSDPALREYALPAPSGADQTLNAGLTGRVGLTPDRSGRGEAPLTVRYAHTFTPGTTGTVSFATTGGFSGQVFLDSDCNGTVSDAERTAVSSVTVDGSWPRLPDGRLRSCALEVEVTVPAGTAVGTTRATFATASLVWAGRPDVQDLASVTDTTTVTPGAELVKTVENLTRADGVVAAAVDALPNERLRYCLNVRNTTPDPLTGVTVSDTLQGVAAYVPGSLTLEGAALTDAADTDAGEIVTRTVTVRLPDLAVGATRRVCFEVLVP
ncbi:hypothetical protein [Deinococcus sp.]|uniref:hypothetical protein n=1 Tax=Deinococcus sp. TaxID=47478 RepID=UPI003919EF81